MDLQPEELFAIMAETAVPVSPIDADGAAKFDRDCHALIDRYFEMEDPTTVREIGLELWMEAEVGALTLRGIIDRLELDADGELVGKRVVRGREAECRARV